MNVCRLSARPEVAASTIDVLVIDDNAVIREMLEDLLLVRGYHVATARHGQEALELLESGPLPGLMLLDLKMPVMDGWTFLERLQDSPWSKVPVVIRTSLVDQPETYEDLPARYGCQVIEKGVGLTPVLDAIARCCGPR